MKIHLQTGPGHHDRYLVEQLRQRDFSFTFSGYYPDFHFSACEKRHVKSKQSRIYRFARWFIWGITNRLKYFRSHNRHLLPLYALYDFLASKKLDNETAVLFGWAQVSLYSIRKMKACGGIVILDYPIPHISKWMKLLEEEATLLRLNNLHSFFSKSMTRRMLNEIDAADYISVPSSFVWNSFVEFGVPKQKLIMNSYGIDMELFTSKGDQRNERFVVLFIGSVEIRKGIHYLLQAWKEANLEMAELRVIGTVQSDFATFNPNFDSTKNVVWLGQLSREETAHELRNAELMVMPSLAEGLSLTILESMASGTPVISTTNAGGADVIDDGIDGFVVPIRDPDAIQKKLMWSYSNRERLREMGALARKKILTSYKQEDYCNRFVERVLTKVDERKLETGSR